MSPQLTTPVSVAHPHAELSERLRQLTAETIEAIGSEFTRKMAHRRAPSVPVLPLKCSAGQYGIMTVAGVMRTPAGRVVATGPRPPIDGSGFLVALEKLNITVLLNILGQMQRGEYSH